MLSKRKTKRFIEHFIYVAAVLYPLTTVSQIIQIFEHQNASGVSLLTWVMYVAFTSVFLIYAAVEKLRPLILEYILWLLVELAVVIGIVIYG